MARLGRQFVAVPFSIPGERVRIELGRTETAPAVLVDVLRASPHRVEAPCPHFGPRARARGQGGPCGGCSWQHIAYPEQLRLKTALVDRLVRAAVPAAPAVRPMLPSTPLESPWAYRHKVHFVFDGAPLIMGHYIRASRHVLPVTECPVHDPRGNAVAFDFYAAFRGARVEAERGGLDGLAVRVGAGTGEMAATLIVSKPADRRVREASRKAIARQAVSTSVHVNMRDKRDAYMFGRETRRISGPERMREIVDGISFLVSPTAFFQTNVHAAEILVRLVRAEVPEGVRVLDLYAGCGLFALPLACAGHDVTAVEDNYQAVGDGEASLRFNRIPESRCRFFAKRVGDFLSRAVKGRGGSYDVVILDPPRDGCEAAVIQQLFGELQPARAIYISCNPEALARDLALITAEGYLVRSLQPVDMFPHTAHVETVVVLERPQGRAR